MDSAIKGGVMIALMFVCTCCVVGGQDNVHQYTNSLIKARAGHVVKVVRVDQFGAKGDGKSDDTKAFAKAWQVACTSSAPSMILVPKGKLYLVKPITFLGPCHSPLTVKVSGTIVAPKDPSAWKGLNPKVWLRFEKVESLTVEGGGTFYGSGQKWWAKSCKVNKANPCHVAPTALTFQSCNNLKVRSLSVKDSQQIHMTFSGCLGVQVNNIKVASPGYSPNTDGIHITGSKNVLIQNSIASTGDDCISIVSGSMQILIQNFICGPGHGISIGSLGIEHSKAEVAHVMVDGAYLHDTTRGLRIKTWQGGSGFARDITFQNVQMKNVTNPVIINQYYCDSAKPCVLEAAAVKVSDVLYRNIKGTTPNRDAVKFACSERVPCKNIVLQDIHLALNSGEKAVADCEHAQGSAHGTVIPPPCF